ncbi:FCS-Like Zinc finger 2-like [Phragmites australis]|uniref:FCS-Like Zinc finger 2-like n=1 Tax=Phragmites australis TaxID=29695 RepID=UPI002D773768|nr:FCS-Like Zinc finger 2-like [Phragmites australis]
MATSLACAFFFDAEPLGEPGRHALDACALCSKPLTRNSDIFMYKGDTPFCSEECRYEQMHFDAAYARQPGRKVQSQRSRREAAAGAGAASVPRKPDVSVASY